MPVRIRRMLILDRGNTVYTQPMAKVMISMPDVLLERIDAQAKAGGETRSGFLQRLAESELEATNAQKRIEIEHLLDELRAEFRNDEPHVDAAQLIREDRESH
jgi:HicB_like antitoxin of bacterial toxin-antitoxin system